MNKSLIQKTLRYMVIFAGLNIMYVMLLMAGEMIPRRLVVDHVLQSYTQLKNQGTYFEVVEGASWDNWTDSYYINSAVTEYDGNLLQKAVANAYTSGTTNKIDDIKYAVDRDAAAVVIPYSRYWAGMRTIYKLLLVFMPVSGIRTLVCGVVVILFALSVICVYRQLGIKGLISYLVSVVIAQYIPQAMCLVYNTDIGIMFLMMVICSVMMNKKASVESFCILFFLAGSVLVYLNYWAFPLITLGFPLVFVISTKLVREYNIRQLTKEMILMSISWGAGLGGTVLAKQILCKMILGSQSGTEQLLQRMGSGYSLADRLISVTNGLTGRMGSWPVLILSILVVVWFVTILNTGGGYKNRYSCFLLVVIAFYPVLWWFVLANHCVHGFVKHMYGVTYYALLSAVLINCDKLIPDFSRLKVKKTIGINACVLVVWFMISYGLIHVNIHYGSRESEPWSLEIAGMAKVDGTIVQEVHFDDFPLEAAYLKSIHTILVNLPEDRKDGILHVEFMENGDVKSTAEIQIADVPVGEWFQIPVGCMVTTEREYQIAYTVYGNEKSEPCLILQSQAQAVGENDILYINGDSVDEALANKYEVDEFWIPVKAKICVAFILLAIMEYGAFLLETEKFGKDMLEKV